MQQLNYQSGKWETMKPTGFFDATRELVADGCFMQKGLSVVCKGAKLAKNSGLEKIVGNIGLLFTTTGGVKGILSTGKSASKFYNKPSWSKAGLLGVTTAKSMASVSSVIVCLNSLGMKFVSNVQLGVLKVLKVALKLPHDVVGLWKGVGKSLEERAEAIPRRLSQVYSWELFAKVAKKITTVALRVFCLASMFIAVNGAPFISLSLSLIALTFLVGHHYLKVYRKNCEIWNFPT